MCARFRKQRYITLIMPVNASQDITATNMNLIPIVFCKPVILERKEKVLIGIIS